MKVEDLDKIPEADDLAVQLEQFKLGLWGVATQHPRELSDDEYKRIRKLLLTNSQLQNLVPDYIKICRNLGEFWQHIKHRFSTYTERRTFIAESLNPILDKIELDENTGAFEFSINYEQHAIIGEGGYGLVYKYHHKLLDIPFAVKVFAPTFYSGGEKELERFFQEAKILFKLNHPNIIRVYDAGMIGKRPYIRMEFFDGLDLNKALQQFGIFSPEKSIELIANVVHGLKHAHEEIEIPIVHRDLKPSNIMVAYPKKFRIIDFGMGIFVENEIMSRITATGESAVGGLYTAPELISDPRLIDKRSDIYSIGAIWYTCLTGQPPAGTKIEKVLTDINGIDVEYIRILTKCLDNIENRYESCTELLNDIEKIAT